MGTSYLQHRIRIGIFNNKSICWRKSKTMAYKLESSCRLDLRFLVLVAFLILFMHYNPASFGNGGSRCSGKEAKTSYYSRKTVEIVNHNFRARYVNGNIKKDGIKILHWNPGSKHLHNKLTNIESLISK